VNAQKEKKLTPKERLFVAEYLKDLNATQAAIRAGYSNARAGGWRLLEAGEQYIRSFKR
jgi:phage terminase small subunit